MGGYGQGHGQEGGGVGLKVIYFVGMDYVIERLAFGTIVFFFWNDRYDIHFFFFFLSPSVVFPLNGWPIR